jgi:RNAse (barnase) inhibitor barstar
MELMKIKTTIYLDFSEINNVLQLYEALANEIGFIDGYGKNHDAVIDCLFGLRYPEEGMTKVNIDMSERIVFQTKNITSAPRDVRETPASILLLLER